MGLNSCLCASPAEPLVLWLMSWWPVFMCSSDGMFQITGILLRWGYRQCQAHVLADSEACGETCFLGNVSSSGRSVSEIRVDLPLFPW